MGTKVGIQSSNITELDYDSTTQELLVVFRGGSVYRYTGVPRSIVDGIISAVSPGKFFNEAVKNSYAFKRVS